MRSEADTIFALSSGRLPSGIAVMRVSGPAAGAALAALAGPLPPPRRAVVRTIAWADEPLDRAMLLWLPGPRTVTGEDIAELHLHGSRAVVRAVEEALAAMPGLRAAEAGEFTRRALDHGRIDLTEAEGLADLLAAETATQRRAALALAGGAFGREIDGWRHRLLALAASVEATLDLGEEEEVSSTPLRLDDAAALAAEIGARLARPPAERLRDGIRVVLAGPPNAGKSMLLNALAGREAAIVAATAGTTRDLIEVPLNVANIPFLLIDTAGLREADDPIERIGVDRTWVAAAAADIILWLGDGLPPPFEFARVIHVRPRTDLAGRTLTDGSALPVSAATGAGLRELIVTLLDKAAELLPTEGEVALNRRHRDCLSQVRASLDAVSGEDDPLILAEHLRIALISVDRLTGKAGVEDMLDAMFAGLCVGK